MNFSGNFWDKTIYSNMSLEIEIASKKMFKWFVDNSSVPKLLANNNVRNIAWETCSSQIRAIFEEGLRLDKEDEDFEENLINVSNKFYDVVVGLIWDEKVDYNDCMHNYFEKCLMSIQG